MVIKFILTLVVQMCQKKIKNINLLQLFLLILYYFMKTDNFIDNLICNLIDNLGDNIFETGKN